MHRLKKYIAVLLSAFFIAALLCGCAQKNAEEQGLAAKALPKQEYEMDLAFDDVAKTLSGTLRVTYHNPTDGPLDVLPFHVYPNAYQHQETAPFFSEEMHLAYPNGFTPGGISFQQVTVDGSAVCYTLANPDQTLMLLQLPQALHAGKSCEIFFSFTVSLPNSLGRFGYGERSYNFCNFYPVACPYLGGKFLTYPYDKAGDPFVSAIADYCVTITLPQDYLLAHSGRELSTEQQGATQRIRISAKDARDFGAVASKDFKIAQEKVQGVQVKSYYYQDQPQTGEIALSAATNAMKTFDGLYGKYLYEDLSIVQTDFFIGGMEYPGMVLIDQSLYSDTDQNPDVELPLEYVVVHEVGHQWWYAAVGNDQVKEPWLDESLTEYSTCQYFNEVYGPQYGAEVKKNYIDDSFTLYQALLKPTEDQLRVGQSMDSFSSSQLYSMAVYLNGARMLYALEEEIGHDTLIHALREYYKINRKRTVTKSNFIQCIQTYSDRDLTEFFEKWL